MLICQINTYNKLLFGLLFFFFLASSAQQKESIADSIHEKRIDSLSGVFGGLLTVDLDSAATVAHYMLRYSNKHEYLKGKGISYGNLGGVSSYKGKQGQAIAYFLKSAEIFELIGSFGNAATTNLNVGILFIDQNQFEEAKVYINKAYEYTIKNDKDNIAMAHIGLGLIDLETNKSLKEVMEHLNKAATAARKQKDTLKLCNALRLQGRAYIKHNTDLPFAISKINEAIQLINSKAPNNHFGLGHAYLNLGKAYWKMGDYKKALSFNDSSLVHYKALNYFKGLRLTYESRKEILASQGKYKEGFEAFKLYSKHNDSTFQQQRANQVARMKIEYETDQIIAQKETAETKVKLAQAISKQNKNYFISSAVIALLILLAALFYVKRLKARKKMELIRIELKETQKRLALEKQYRDSELKALKAQMNPHFIFNALNSIQEYIVLNKKNLASDYLGKFADLIRKYLHHSDAGTITIQEETESLEMYLELESLRFEEELEYKINISEALKEDQVLIPTMLIQPYVENALKHGLLHRLSDRKLVIDFTKNSNKLIICTIEDNGVGREEVARIQKNIVKEHPSFATKATASRLDLLNYANEIKIGVIIEDLLEKDATPKGTKVTLTIPLIST